MVMLVLLIYFIFFPLLIRLFGPQCFRWWFMGARAQAVLVNPGITLKCLHFYAVRTDFTSSYRIQTRKRRRTIVSYTGAVIAWFWVCSTFFFFFSLLLHLFIAHAVARTTIWRNIFFFSPNGKWFLADGKIALRGKTTNIFHNSVFGNVWCSFSSPLLCISVRECVCVSSSVIFIPFHRTHTLCASPSLFFHLLSSSAIVVRFFFSPLRLLRFLRHFVALAVIIITCEIFCVGKVFAFMNWRGRAGYSAIWSFYFIILYTPVTSRDREMCVL